MATAIVLSIVALGVSVLAAGFTGWQAITGHLARTRPTHASWTVEYTTDRHSQGVWKLHNTGGSTATDVVLTARNPLATNPEFETLRLEANGAVPAGESRTLKGSENKVSGTALFHATPNEKGHYEPAPAGTKSAIHIFARKAEIEWRDFRGKSRSDKINLW